MATFSERYGYTKASDVIIREKITEPIKNSILNWLHYLEESLKEKYYQLEKNAWIFFLDRDITKYENSYNYRTIVIRNEINNELQWFKKLNLIEFILVEMNKIMESKNYNDSVKFLNFEFERHNFAYRIVGDKIEEITTEVEIESIETALKNPNNSVHIHLQAALKFLSVAQENPDYRNSIKESISAVEACCREKTGESTLGKALSKLESKGIILPNVLKKAFELQYNYTNDKTTGIRHALMDDKNPPSSAEAIYMLVSCSAFINYLVQKSQI